MLNAQYIKFCQFDSLTSPKSELNAKLLIVKKICFSPPITSFSYLVNLIIRSLDQHPKHSLMNPGARSFLTYASKATTAIWPPENLDFVVYCFTSRDVNQPFTARVSFSHRWSSSLGDRLCFCLASCSISGSSRDPVWRQSSLRFGCLQHHQSDLNRVLQWLWQEMATSPHTMFTR